MSQCVGIYHGGSIQLWSDYFTNANVYGIDSMHIDNVYEGLKQMKHYIIYII